MNGTEFQLGGFCKCGILFSILALCFLRLEIIGDLRGFNRILGILIGGVAIPPNGETACFDFCLFFLSVFFLPMVSHVDHVKKRKSIV